MLGRGADERVQNLGALCQREFGQRMTRLRADAPQGGDDFRPEILGRGGVDHGPAAFGVQMRDHRVEALAVLDEETDLEQIRAAVDGVGGREQRLVGQHVDEAAHGDVFAACEQQSGDRHRARHRKAGDDRLGPLRIEFEAGVGEKVSDSRDDSSIARSGGISPAIRPESMGPSTRSDIFALIVSGSSDDSRAKPLKLGRNFSNSASVMPSRSVRSWPASR